jgi:hypothetical protein
MTTTLTEPAPAEATEADVQAAYAAYQESFSQPFGPVVHTALERLLTVAELADVPLCEWGDNNPNDVTVRSCCGDKVCDIHEEEHDLLCPEFAAQLREESM